MFCPSCGQEIKGDDVKYCPHCGYELQSKTPDSQEVVDAPDGIKKTSFFEYQENTSKNPAAGIVLGIFSIILAVPTIGILGLILGVVGLINSKDAAGKTLNIIGIVFSGAVFLSFFLAAFDL
jgi:uncharacterized membrane protein YvbJ